MTSIRVRVLTMMGALLVIACGGSAGSAGPTVARPQGSTGQAETSLTPAVAPTVPVLSDSAIKSLVIVNIKSDPDATSAIPLDATRAPNIMVRDGVLTVATTDATVAASLCGTVAGMTNSPDTGEPLGITEVVVILPGYQSVARCRP